MSADRLRDALDRLDAGDWHGAHQIAQSLDTVLGAWLHAHIHRIEGDLANAHYWDRRAGRATEAAAAAPTGGELRAERDDLRAAVRRMERMGADRAGEA